MKPNLISVKMADRITGKNGRNGIMDNWNIGKANHSILYIYTKVHLSQIEKLTKMKLRIFNTTFLHELYEESVLIPSVRLWRVHFLYQ